MDDVGVSVIVSTFGDESWKKMAEHAIQSAEKAGAKEVLHNHCDTLHEARNRGLEQASCEWVIHLDADDFLYETFIEEASKGTSDVRVPSIAYSYSTQFNLRNARIPAVPGHKHCCVPNCLEKGNYVIVGAMAKVALLREVGGWKDYEALEDFDLWQRCWLAGASFENKPKAVYLARSRPMSRNRQSPKLMKQIHYEISKTNMPERNWEWILR